MAGNLLTNGQNPPPIPMSFRVNTIQYSSAYYAYQRVVPTKFFNMPGPSHAINISIP